jgi:hypothetical protein
VCLDFFFFFFFLRLWGEEAADESWVSGFDPFLPAGVGLGCDPTA